MKKMLGRVAAACLLGAATLAQAQVPTDKGPMRLVIGYPAGGAGDVMMRLLAEKLRPELGIQIVVENRTGAGGAIAADHVRQSAPDGLTVMFGNTHMFVMLPLTTPSVRYDPLKDFQPIGQMSEFYEALVVNGKLPATSMKDWLALSRRDAKAGSFGVPAAGSVSQFMGFRMSADYDARLLAVPYRGTAPLVADLLGGQIAGAITPILDVAPHHVSGKLKVLAVNGKRRSPGLPEVPTLSELGIPNYEELEWTGLFAPAGTPPATVRQLNAAMNKVLQQPEFKTALAKLGQEVATSTPEELHALIARSIATWRPVVEASGFKAD